VVQLSQAATPAPHPTRAIRTDRRALLLYTVLVLVPALVLGGLLFSQLLSSHSNQLAQLPREVRDGAARLRSGIESRLRDLIAREDAREFYHYHQDYWEKGTILGAEGRPTLAPITSNLALKLRPPGVLAWFSWNLTQEGDQEPLLLRGRPQVPHGLTSEQEVDLWSAEAMRGLDQQDFVRDVLMWHESQQPFEAFSDEFHGAETSVGEPFPIELLALNLGSRRDPACLNADIGLLRRSIGDLQTLRVHTGPLRLEGRHDKQGQLRLIAIRKIFVEPLPALIPIPTCFAELGQDTILVQGFELDSEWFLNELPNAEALRILGPSIKMFGPKDKWDQGSADYVTSRFNLFEELDVALDDELDFERAWVEVAFPSSELRRRLRTTLASLLGVGTIMIISLVVGVRLLRSSVQKSQERARRTENFVAAVTHELRTPLASVKLYSEMLRDGWADNEQKRADYLQRIVRETNRLDTLVDGLLESRRLADMEATPEPGSLNEAVQATMPELKMTDGTEATDITFNLQEDLPPVLMEEGAVRGILVNLVENARKYAPVEKGTAPLEVRTSLDRRGRVLLEVADRGPGIPSSERGRIFDAFYRVGDESTRTTHGTGLGLHLVQMHVDAIRARVRVTPRKGGGSIFQVTLRSTPSKIS
jgi:signal transduction histidine kinase